MQVIQCHLCTSKNLVQVLDLGFHPLADLFLVEDELHQVEKRYPLSVLLCQNCGHAMNSFVVSGEERYQEHDYSFDSGHSKISINHFEEMARDVVTYARMKEGDMVVDIGSNVGTLLQVFKENGMKVLGVDPAQNIATIANERGIPTINDFFSTRVNKEIVKRGRPKVITSVNCLNHIDDLDTFMENIVSVLADDGVCVFEVPHFLQILKRMQFDTVYLEHISYIAVKPLVRYVEKFDMKIMRVEENDYLGGMLRIFIGRGNADESVERVIAKEEAAQLFSEETFVPYREQVLRCKLQLLSDLVDARVHGGRIVAIGAAAKGNTLLNYCGIDNSLIDFATDISPLKIGKYTPGSHLPIQSDDAIDASVTHALILAWNLAEFLKGKIAPKHPHLKFITPHVVLE